MATPGGCLCMRANEIRARDEDTPPPPSPLFFFLFPPYNQLLRIEDERAKRSATKGPSVQRYRSR